MISFDKTYWIITDTLEVKEVQNMLTSKDMKRLNCGNYFTSKEQALKVLKKVKMLFMTEKGRLL